jgi:hypothetical protein
VRRHLLQCPDQRRVVEVGHAVGGAGLLKVLGDITRDGRVERTATDMQRIQIPAVMKKPVCEYEQYCCD